MLVDQVLMRKTYDEWVELLKRTHNEDLLEDPYAVWVEAFHVATIVTTQGANDLSSTG